jgi:hypothetical protein
VEVAYLYTAYRAWCQNRSFDALSIDALGDAVIEGAEIDAVRSRRRVYLLGLKLVEPSQEGADIISASSTRAA